MPLPKTDPRAAEFIDSLKNEKMKTHVKRDGSERVVVLYEAPANIQDGERCLATIYQYSGSNLVPSDSREKEAIWDGDWDFDELVNGEDGYTE